MACLSAEGGETRPGNTVVFVCEHGSVKSLIATQWFNKRAAEQGLMHRAISRGMAPDAAVPKGIVDKLRDDGFAVEKFMPTRLSSSDLGDTERVISIGVDVSSVTKESGVKVEEWHAIPPASDNYAASRDAMLARMDRLLADLKSTGPTSSPAAPVELLGEFQDDYGSRFRISPTEWVHLPRSRYHIVLWDPAGQYLIARNDDANSSAGGLWTRIDWVAIPGMAPYTWAFCMSAYEAPTRQAAEATNIARRETPRTGCNGFPFSRMRRQN